MSNASVEEIANRDEASPKPFSGAAAPRRVLVVAYLFPPVGGAGVQRVTKFVKYLGQFGWTPSVLTVSNPSVPAWDASLLREIPPDVQIRRCRTLEPSYSVKAAVAGDKEQHLGAAALARKIIKGAAYRVARFALQPDPAILWMPGALREGKRLLRQTPHDAIVVTGPPFSAFLVGAALSRASRLPLILDYRDEWDLSNSVWENKKFDPFSLWLQQRLQRRAVRQASVLLATTQCSADSLRALRDRVKGTADVTCIYNGFDPADFSAADAAAAAPGDGLRLVYTGTLWNLTSVAPLVAAVRSLAQRNPAATRRLELVFAGRRTPQQQQILDELSGLPCNLVQHPYLDHQQSVALLRSAGGLCALLSDLPGADRVVPAKLFEYMAARRPIWVIAPKGEMWNLLREHPCAHLHEPADVAGLSASLEREIQQPDQDALDRLKSWKADAYDRRCQAGELAAMLDSVCVERR